MSSTLENSFYFGRPFYYSSTYSSKASYCVNWFTSSAGYDDYNRIKVFKHNNKYIVIVTTYQYFTRDIEPSVTSDGRENFIGSPVIYFPESFLSDFVSTYGFKIKSCGYIMCFENYYT